LYGTASAAGRTDRRASKISAAMTIKKGSMLMKSVEILTPTI
jgi:hypothetical protein